MSTLVFEGIVLEIETATAHEKAFPIKATVEKILKGKTGLKEISMTYKDPGKYAIFEAEYNTPETNQKGTFYVKAEPDSSFTLIGYHTGTPRACPWALFISTVCPSGIPWGDVPSAIHPRA